MCSDLTLWMYIAAAAAALTLVVLLGSKAWYLHVISILLGFMAGLMPPIGDDPRLFYIIAGTAFTFFLFWGLGGILLRTSIQPFGSNPAQSDRGTHFPHGSGESQRKQRLAYGINQVSRRRLGSPR
jgi:hypothetical protein